MIRKITTIVAVLALSAGTLFAQAAKTAVINMGEVINGFSKTAAVLESIKADVALIQEQEKSAVAELNKKAEELQKKIKEIENPLNSDSAKKKAEAEARELNKALLKERQELAAALDQAKRALDEKRQGKLNELLKEIAPVIKEYAEKNGIEIVINVANGAVVYAASAADITKPVNALLAERFPAEKKAEAAAPEAK
ncbi:MAG: OmpH family outer membrane protein [Candidatus Spyradosoma sp.]